MILNEKVFVKSVILNKFFFELSDFVSTFSQRVRFWINFFTTRQILNQLFYNGSDFESTFFTTTQILNQLFYNASDFESTFFTTTQILNQLFKHASDLDLNVLQRVRFWVYFFCKLAHFLAFIIRGHVLRYGVGSVSQVILLE